MIPCLVRPRHYWQEEDNSCGAWTPRGRFEDGSPSLVIGFYSCLSSIKSRPLQADAAQVCLYQGTVAIYVW